MPRTTQCIQCGVVLNVPDQAIGRRLKCPKCGTKFAVAPGAEGSPDSTFLPSTKPPSSQEQISARNSSAEGMPTAPGDLRGTFDLPSMHDDAGGSGTRAGTTTVVGTKQTADALALFNDQPATQKRRPSPAEARSKARRCTTCGNVIPVGMSICSRCGLDLESGSRVALDDDLAPRPLAAPAFPLPVAIIGGICFLGSVISTITTLSLWIRGAAGFQYFVPLCLFAVFASVQFLRRKSVRLLLIALTFGLALDIVALIAVPIWNANTETGAIQRTGPVDDPEMVDIAIPSVVERLDTQSLSLGIGLILVYAGVTVYLLSPQVRRHYRQ